MENKETKNEPHLNVLPDSMTQHHGHQHLHGKKSCCGDCKGQGSCGKMTKVSFIAETTQEIATFK